MQAIIPSIQGIASQRLTLAPWHSKTEEIAEVCKKDGKGKTNKKNLIRRQQLIRVWECWKKPPAAFSPFCRAHVLHVRSARQNGCGLAGRTFLREASGQALNIPSS
jgi:hypothetical protein